MRGVCWPGAAAVYSSGRQTTTNQVMSYVTPSIAFKGVEERASPMLALVLSCRLRFLGCWTVHTTVPGFRYFRLGEFDVKCVVMVLILKINTIFTSSALDTSICVCVPRGESKEYMLRGTSSTVLNAG